MGKENESIELAFTENPPSGVQGTSPNSLRHKQGALARPLGSLAPGPGLGYGETYVGMRGAPYFREIRKATAPREPSGHSADEAGPLAPGPDLGIADARISDRD